MESHCVFRCGIYSFSVSFGRKQVSWLKTAPETTKRPEQIKLQVCRFQRNLSLYLLRSYSSYCLYIPACTRLIVTFSTSNKRTSTLQISKIFLKKLISRLFCSITLPVWHPKNKLILLSMYIYVRRSLVLILYGRCGWATIFCVHLLFLFTILYLYICHGLW